MGFLKKTTIFLLVLFLLPLTKTNANDICPENMTLDQCYSNLTRKMADLERQSKAVSQNLSAEKYNQLSLSQQIEYTTRKIAESETEIKKTEIELETKNVEIRMMERDIEETQNNIATVSQESQKLESSISKRLSISYKYSFMNPLELFMNSQDLDSLTRKIKYLIETRNNDRVLLTEMKNKSVVLDAEERVLAKRKLDLEKIRIEVEAKKTELVKQKETLASQQTEHTRLLAISRDNEQQILANLNLNRKKQSEIDAAIIEWIAKNSHLARNSGPVEAGATIGRMGNTGKSYGAHLHFSIGTWNSVAGYGNINPWDGYLTKGPDYWKTTGDGWIYYYIRSGKMTLPLAGATVLTQNYHQGTAIDLVSLLGEGAPVYAAMGGTLYTGKVDVYGGKYAYIIHPNNLKTTYLHLQ